MFLMEKRLEKVDKRLPKVDVFKKRRGPPRKAKKPKSAKTAKAFNFVSCKNHKTAQIPWLPMDEKESIEETRNPLALPELLDVETRQRRQEFRCHECTFKSNTPTKLATHRLRMHKNIKHKDDKLDFPKKDFVVHTSNVHFHVVKPLEVVLVGEEHNYCIPPDVHIQDHNYFSKASPEKKFVCKSKRCLGSSGGKKNVTIAVGSQQLIPIPIHAAH